MVDENPRLTILLPLFKMRADPGGKGGSKRRHSDPIQGELRFERAWGGRRTGAGRKTAKRRKGVPHRVRPQHKARHPLHVTLRVAKRLPSLRKQVVFLEVRRALARASRTWFRVLQFSVQADHVHLLLEARDKGSLSRGMAGLAILVSRAINRKIGRQGRVWADRYHARELSSPREVRHAIVYVLTNWIKHVRGARGVDPCSSAFWFDGWKLPPGSGPPDWDDEASPIVSPRTWLAQIGWRRLGLVSRSEHAKVQVDRFPDWIP
jgi:putative transposase